MASHESIHGVWDILEAVFHLCIGRRYRQDLSYRSTAVFEVFRLAQGLSKISRKEAQGKARKPKNELSIIA